MRAALVFVTLLLATLVPGVPATAAPPDDRVPVDARVRQQVNDKGSATFWVVLAETADLSGAADVADWDDRGRFVMDRLTATARKTQQPVAAALRGAGATVRGFWAANVLLVTGGRGALDAVTTRADVREVAAPTSFAVSPDPRPAAVTALEDSVPAWGVRDVGAPRVWDEFGTRGEGVTVGVIDTGAQHDHPALAASYRGRAADGSVSHDHNWWDPSARCGGSPCDDVSHGTHVTGTITGADGIGVAPGARWIAAKGCEADLCSEQALLSSGQWMLAPTDRAGQNPRPDLRPQVVNNSWSDPNGANSWYRQVVQAWVAAGILPVFAAGNNGPSCRSAGSPGSYPESYAVGAYDESGAVASFSGRGSSALDRGTKPDVSAPGVAVLSALPDGEYGYGDGTSMAAPHVAGAAALVFGAAPVLRGETGLVRGLLDGTARDAEDLTCGGTSTRDNVYGAGRLDAYLAVTRAPRGSAGFVAGRVTDTGSGAPVAGARVRTDSGAEAVTDADGRYRLAAVAGPAEVAVSAFGYTAAATTTEVPVGDVVTEDVRLTSLPRFTVSGRLVDAAGTTQGGMPVSVLDSPLPAVTTDADGTFVLTGVPVGQHEVGTTGNACLAAARAPVTVDGDEQVTVTAQRLLDARGYGCHLAEPAFRAADTVLPINGDRTSYSAQLPFPTRLYGVASDRVRIFVDGRVTVGTSSVPDQGPLLPQPVPSEAAPNASLYPFWSDLYVDPGASVRTGTYGTAPNREFVIEWRDVLMRDALQREPLGGRVTVQAVLGEDGSVRFQYAGLDDDVERGGGTSFVSVLTGIEDEQGRTAIQFSHNQPVLGTDRALVFDPPTAGSVSGRITDANDGLPVGAAENAVVTVTDPAGATVLTSPVVGGQYNAVLPPGDYTVTATATDYVTAGRKVTVAAGRGLSGVDLTLASGRLEYATERIVLRPAGAPVFTHDLVIRNTGGVAAGAAVWLDFPRPSWLTVPDRVPDIPPGGQATLRLSVDATGVPAGDHFAQFSVMPATGRGQDTWVSVNLKVPAYARSVDAGGGGLTGWGADRPFSSAAGWGYEATGTTTVSTGRAIAGTDADALYRTARAGNTTYRFTGLPAGTYRVDLAFAEIENVKARQRRFDVTANGQPIYAALDVAALVGRDTALDKSFTVTVSGGDLRVSLTALPKSLRPLLAGLRITHLGA